MKMNRIFPILLVALSLFLAGCQAAEPADTTAVEATTPR